MARAFYLGLLILHYEKFYAIIALMEIVAVKDGFICAVLGEGDLEVFFDAKHLSYSDDNPEHDSNRTEVLAAMARNGPDHFSFTFNRAGNTAFILLDEQDRIQGNSELHYDPFRRVVTFEGDHIHSDLRGRHLVDLFYQARETHVRGREYYRLLRLTTKPENTSSQRAATRNGFVRSGSTADGNFIFEKTL